MYRADYYEREGDGVRCKLCPHKCLINNGNYGICHVRKNIDGELISMNYGIISARNLDRIEKKPLYHFYPGRTIFSIGSVGCNLSCKYCQNHTIAQGDFTHVFERAGKTSPKTVVEQALRVMEDDNIGIAYTYNEPIIWYEYMRDIAVEARKAGLKNVMVSNGYIEEEPLRELMEVIDAFSIDLKGYSEEFYREITGSTLAPVKKTLEIIAKSNRHLEVEYLVIPGHNDDEVEFRKLMEWYRDRVGKGVPLHINRYFPQYRMTIDPTPVETLVKLFEIAREYVNHVYIGNVGLELGRDTICPGCGSRLIERRYEINYSRAVGGRCYRCGRELEGEGYE